ncbi:MATE family efflux transporter [Alkalibacter saccharofermentans]|uniref:Multidrug export protein MepA n=1 Tax=Alkalibacter saccharofermentans DSM 14828 TaxID=1120975 RepID=A0A1M4VKL6_9FIRM|nr:MATE family efflux transporter [Alkalibacter saccharofermentans]SHE69372.1 putative efflux protein, MATE family [Alkalibacter saccharofermentans DSM 14828]
MDNATQLGEAKVSKLLIKFSVPAIIGMLVNAIYNLVDRIYIGNGVGSLGIGATTVGFPVMLIAMAFSMLIGFGANSIISIRLGEQKKEAAEKVLGNAFVLFIGVALSITVLGLAFLEPMLRFFGASEAIMPYAKDYMTIILAGNIFQSLSFGMNNFIRAEGNPQIAMKTMLIGAGINIVLDPIFIFTFGWGMKGAAFATVLSQAVSMVWVLYYFFGGKSLLKIHKSNMRLEMKTIKLIATLGFAPFAMQIASSLQNMVLNQSLLEYGGDVAISGMGITISVITLILMPMFGINQGVQPIIGYNYGARKYDRVKEALKLGIMAAVGIATFGFVATRLFPEQLVSIFNRSDAELIAIGKLQMKISLSMLPLIGFQVVGSNYFQAVGKPKHASFLSLSRQFFFLIPALLIIPRFFGLKGVYASMPLADLLASMVTAVFLIREMRHLDTSHAQGLTNRKEKRADDIKIDENIIKESA